MQDRLSAGKGRLARTVEVLSKVNSLVRKADSLYMYYAWLEAATISIVTLATFWGAGMLLSFGTTTIPQQIFMAVALYYMLHTLFTAVAGAVKEYRCESRLGASGNCRAAPSCVKCARHFPSLLGDLRGKKISKAARMDDAGCSRTKEVSKAQDTDRKNRTRAEENRRCDATEGV
jgi:hypothetical protein